MATGLFKLLFNFNHCHCVRILLGLCAERASFVPLDWQGVCPWTSPVYHIQICMSPRTPLLSSTLLYSVSWEGRGAQRSIPLPPALGCLSDKKHQTTLGEDVTV